MKYDITHASEYSYSTPAALSLNDACLLVRSTEHQTVTKHSITTEPRADHHRDRQDWFGNLWRFYAFERPHQRLVIVSHHVVEVNRTWTTESGPWEPFLYPSPFIRPSETLAAYGRSSFPPGGDPMEGLTDLTRRLFQDFHYDPKATEIGTPVEEFFRNRRGVCQDYAHLMIAILRSLGVPGRYVSGYLNTLPPPGKEKVLGADASHAWVGAWVAGQGWRDFDPTNGLVVGHDHITVAWGRDYGDVTPLKGVVLGGGNQTLEVKVTVLTV